MASYFPEVLDDHTALYVIRRLQDWSTESVNGDIRDFFKSLSKILLEVFNAQLITIWDNNHYGKCLVLQASKPERQSFRASHTVPTETSATGIAVETRALVYHSDIRNPGLGRYFTNPAIIEDLNLTTMISVPVFSLNKKHHVSLVINFCFDFAHEPNSPISEEDAHRLLNRLSLSLQYLVYKRDEEINNHIRAIAASAKGIPSLFDGIYKKLQEVTQCTHSALFSLDKTKKSLVLERSTDLTAIEGNATPKEGIGITDQDNYDSQILSVCVQEGKPLVIRDDKSRLADGHLEDVQCVYMAVPVRSASGEVIGIIRCKDPIKVERKAPSFSSLDLHALVTFSQALAPSIERFLHIREGGNLMKVILNVSKSLVKAYQLDATLQRTIATLVEALHSEMGSIYLLDEETNTFVMRAANGPNSPLIGEAKYKVGEGITGEIAAGNILNFKSMKEIRSHPSHLGKYDPIIYGTDSKNLNETLLGVPIIIGDKVIGLWKVANIHSTDDHPDPYYTDEDKQIAVVLSSFIAYAIQNHKQEQNRLRQFTLLAQSSIQIQQSTDEEEAISSVLIALEKAGFEGALLSLYEPQTQQITATLSSGSTWMKIIDRLTIRLDEDDIRAIVLRTNKEEFTPNSAHDPRCARDIELGIKIQAQCVLPLRLEDELIGTLQVDLGRRKRTRDSEMLILKAFASHLSITISRMRSIKRSIELTNQVLASSRFITAETLSGMAVHSLHHKIKDITRQLKKDLEKQEIREKDVLLQTLGRWNKSLGELEAELKGVLQFVRSPFQEADLDPIDIHPQIQIAIDAWINYIRSNKSSINPPTLDAVNSICDIRAEAFREIMAVLLVNAVQAHAKRISIKTYNDFDVKTPVGKTISAAFCLECSDDGVGLTSQDHEKIFEATYTTKPKNLGTGLGLFVARRLARISGGDLEAIDTNKRSRGATFRLSLPITEGGR